MEVSKETTTPERRKAITTATATSRITRVNFTYAIPDGMWIEREDGSRRWEHYDGLLEELGYDELMRLMNIAMPDNGMTGMWYNADNGEEVN